MQRKQHLHKKKKNCMTSEQHTLLKIDSFDAGS